MRLKRRLLIAFVPICLMLGGVVYLARPEDELAGMMRLFPPDAQTIYSYPEAPGIYSHPGAPGGTPAGTVFTFIDNPSVVMNSLPGKKTISRQYDMAIGGSGWSVVSVVLPSGRLAELVYFDAWSKNSPWCTVTVYNDNRAWYERSWSSFKRRLGAR